MKRHLHLLTSMAFVFVCISVCLSSLHSRQEEKTAEQRLIEDGVLKSVLKNMEKLDGLQPEMAMQVKLDLEKPAKLTGATKDKWEIIHGYVADDKKKHVQGTLVLQQARVVDIRAVLNGVHTTGNNSTSFRIAYSTARDDVTKQITAAIVQGGLQNNQSITLNSLVKLPAGKHKIWVEWKKIEDNATVSITDHKTDNECVLIAIPLVGVSLSNKEK